MAEDKDKATYSKSSAQLDLERFQATENGEDPTPDTPARDMTVEGNDLSGFYGVDPIYKQYSSDTHKPLRTTEGPMAVVEDRAYGEKASDEDVAVKATETTTTTTSKPTAKSTPPAPSKPSTPSAPSTPPGS
jgi:hypothetical protein